MKKNILVIDDDQAMLDSLDLILSEEGYDVETMIDGRSLENISPRYVPDIILIDYFLPDENGIQIVRKLKKQKNMANTPIIMMSAAYHLTKQNLSPEVDDFFSKPFDINKLMASIKQHLRKKKE
ncbi:MAG: response regulator [Patescibacteria group bacterium]